MKKIIIIGACVLAACLVAAPFLIRQFGSQIIQVAPPSGEPIGEFELPRTEDSLLAVKIVVPLASLQETLNAEAPRRIEGQEKKNIHKRIKNGSYAWAVERGDVVLQNTGSGLAFGAPIQGAAQVQGQLDAKIISIPITGTAEIAGTLNGTLAPKITRQWKIIPNLEPSVSLSKAQLNIANFANLEIRDLLESQLNPIVRKEARKIGPKLEKKTDLKKEVQELWDKGHLVEQVSDEPAVWITVDPLGIQMSPIDYSDPEAIATFLAIETRTALTNIEPDPPTPKALPKLKTVETPPKTLLRIPLVISISQLNEALSKETFTADTSFGADIEFTGVEAKVGQNGFINFSVELSAGHSRIGKGVEGKIWLEGKPIINYEAQTLAFSDVALTLETRDQLTATAAWLLEGVLVKAIQKEMRVDLNRYRDELDEEVEKALQSSKLPEGIEISVKDLEVKLADIYTTTRQFPGGDPDPGVVLVISATGEASSRLTRFK